MGGFSSRLFSSNRNATIEAVNNLTAVTQEILARPVVYGASADDITELVRAELGLPDPAEAEAEPADADVMGPTPPAGP